MYWRKATTVLSLIIGSFVLVSGFFIVVGCETEAQPQEGETTAPHVVADTPVEAGRYLAVVGGCNDCHTAGYLEKEGQIPEEDWLAGSPVGWRGPWGTTYASNLRRYVQTVSEDEWVAVMHARSALPPMPWMNVHQMSEPDVRALYQYIQSLGSKGEEMPRHVPPEQEPETPYVSMVPQNMGVAGAEQDTTEGGR